MSCDDTEQAELLFEKSLELPADQREEWLRNQCGSNSSLYAEVCELFSLQMEASDLFAQDFQSVDSMPSSGSLQTGSTIGDFLIGEQIGEGGMGIVYRAVQQSLNRTVALKLLRPSACQSANHRKRFQIEIEAAARLQHANIVGVHTTGREGDILFYAMELIDGPSVAELIDDLKENPNKELADCASTVRFDQESGHQLSDTVLHKPGSTDHGGSKPRSPGVAPGRQPGDSSNYFDWIASLIAEVADGVQFAHENDVLHRDIKPSNLLVDRDGKARIGDFGLARDLSEPGITQTGELIGTPYYMAPEQVTTGGVIGRAVDIYSLGATLYQLLTLRPPFPGDSRDRVLAKIATEEPTPPRRINQRAPMDLETICLKSLEKAAEDRYLSAGEFADDLRRFVRRESIQAKRASVVDRFMKWIDRHRSLAASIAALPVCIAVVATVFAFRNHRLAVALQAETHRANTSVFEAKVEQARAILGTTRLNRRSEALHSIRIALDLLPQLQGRSQEQSLRKDTLRQEVVSALAAPELIPERVWEVSKPWTSEVEFTRDYRLYAQPARDGPIRIRHVDDEVEERLLVGATAPARQMKFSPNGRYLASKHYTRGPSDGATLYVWDLDQDSDSQLSPILELAQRQIYVLDFAFAGRHAEFACAKSGGGVEIYSLEHGKLLHEIPTQSTGPTLLSYSMDDLLAVVPYRGNQLEIWETHPKPRILSSIESERRFSAVTWKARGAIAAGTTNGEVHFWDDGIEQAPRVLRPHTREITNVQFRPMGTMLATRTLNEEVSISDTATLTSQPVSKRDERMHLTCAGFSSDAKKLGYRRPSEFGFFQVADTVLSVLVADDSTKPVHQVRFHPYDSKLLARSVPAGIELWDTASNKLLDTIAIDGHFSIIFSPDGKYLFAGSLRQGGVSRWPIEIQRNEMEELDIQYGSRQEIYRGSCLDLSLSATGKYVAIKYRYSEDRSWDLTVVASESGEEVFQHHFEQEPRFVIFESDDTQFATVYADASVAHVWSTETGKLVGDRPFFLPSEARDLNLGRGLAVDAQELQIQFFDVLTGKVVSSVPLERRRLLNVQFSRDGQLAVTNSGATGPVLIDVAKGKILTKLVCPTEKGNSFFDFSPDGSQLAIAGFRDIHVWHLDRLREELDAIGLPWE